MPGEEEELLGVDMAEDEFEAELKMQMAEMEVEQEEQEEARCRYQIWNVVHRLVVHGAVRGGISVCSRPSLSYSSSRTRATLPSGSHPFPRYLKGRGNFSQRVKNLLFSGSSSELPYVALVFFDIHCLFRHFVVSSIRLTSLL